MPQACVKQFGVQIYELKFTIMSDEIEHLLSVRVEGKTAVGAHLILPAMEAQASAHRLAQGYIKVAKLGALNNHNSQVHAGPSLLNGDTLQSCAPLTFSAIATLLFNRSLDKAGYNTSNVIQAN